MGGAELAVVADAVRAEPPRPGRMHQLDVDSAAAAPPHGSASSHALGLGAAVELGRAVDRMPARLHIYSIEGADFGLGPGMTPQVAAAVPAVATRIAALLV